jgi:hypothetical protein
VKNIKIIKSRLRPNVADESRNGARLPRDVSLVYKTGVDKEQDVPGVNPLFLRQHRELKKIRVDLRTVTNRRVIEKEHGNLK